MEISSFSAIETEFIYRVHRVVWCNLATIDTLNRPQYIKEQTTQVSAY